MGTTGATFVAERRTVKGLTGFDGKQLITVGVVSLAVSWVVSGMRIQQTGDAIVAELKKRGVPIGDGKED